MSELFWLTETVSIILFDVFLKVVFKFKVAFLHVTRKFFSFGFIKGKHFREVYSKKSNTIFKLI